MSEFEEADREQSAESIPPVSSVSTVTEGQQPAPTCPECGSTEHTVHPVPTCSECGSTEHTVHPQAPAPAPTCPDCGSTAHTVHPTCGVCGSKDHTSHPTCPTCGSTEHTAHPQEPQHYHGNGSDEGYCPVCNLHYSPNIGNQQKPGFGPESTCCCMNCGAVYGEGRDYPLPPADLVCTSCGELIG